MFLNNKVLQNVYSYFLSLNHCKNYIMKRTQLFNKLYLTKNDALFILLPVLNINHRLKILEWIEINLSITRQVLTQEKLPKCSLEVFNYIETKRK